MSVLKLGRGRVPMRVSQCYAIVGVGAEGQRSGSVVGTGRTRLQLICCALTTEPMVSDDFKGGRDRRREKGSDSD